MAILSFVYLFLGFLFFSDVSLLLSNLLIMRPLTYYFAPKPKPINNTTSITSYGIKILWLLFTLFIFYGALIPFDFSFNNEQIIQKIRNFHWVPFVNADGSRHSIPDIVQNIIFFILFGFCTISCSLLDLIFIPF